MSNNTCNSNVLLNKQFVIFDEIFSHDDWVLAENSYDRVVYSKQGFELDVFSIKLDASNIYISVPLKNSDFNYAIKFTDFSLAYDYVERNVLAFNSSSS